MRQQTVIALGIAILLIGGQTTAQELRNNNFNRLQQFHNYDYVAPQSSSITGVDSNRLESPKITLPSTGRSVSFELPKPPEIRSDQFQFPADPIIPSPPEPADFESRAGESTRINRGQFHQRTLSFGQQAATTYDPLDSTVLQNGIVPSVPEPQAPQIQSIQTDPKKIADRAKTALRELEKQPRGQYDPGIPEIGSRANTLSIPTPKFQFGTTQPGESFQREGPNSLNRFRENQDYEYFISN